MDRPLKAFLTRVLPLLMLAGLTSVAVGLDHFRSPEPDTASSATSPPATAAEPTSTEAPASDVEIAGRPVKILFAGDSMVEGVRPPIEAAFTTPDFLFAKQLVPGFVNEHVSENPLWPEVLARENPDVIVLLFGVWENAALRSNEVLDTGDPGWVDTYRNEMVEPVIDEVLASGAALIWVSMTTVRDPDITEEFAELNQIWRSVAAEHDAVHWINSQALLTDGAGRFVEIDPDANAPFKRIINPDGLHLCAGAGYRLAPPIIDTIEGLTGLSAVQDWAQSPWSEDRFGYIPGECDQPGENPS